ncbi:hypothetical protein D1007_48251 [Hordeum vulgare]|nr:hypothetical protein D1007_48251 [Hordeum vulgare]
MSGFFRKGKGKAKKDVEPSLLQSPSRWTLVTADGMARRSRDMKGWHALVMPEQRCAPVYTPGSPNWDAWFATEHDVRCRSAVQIEPDYASSPPMAVQEDEEADATYVATLEEAYQHTLEESK